MTSKILNALRQLFHMERRARFRLNQRVVVRRDCVQSWLAGRVGRVVAIKEHYYAKGVKVYGVLIDGVNYTLTEDVLRGTKNGI